jgi:hypothetical protein
METKKEYKGKKVMCIKMFDPFPVPSGTCGIITHVDDIGNIHVNWDNGQTLALIPNHDKYTFIP